MRFPPLPSHLHLRWRDGLAGEDHRCVSNGAQYLIAMNAALSHLFSAVRF